MNTVPKSVAALGGALVLALALAGCGADDTAATSSGASASSSASSSATAQHNEADVTFAQDMIVHHASAIAMAELAPDRAASREVKALAEKVKAAQGPEIETMTSWLKAWGQEVPETGDHATMGDGGASEMPGMMTAEQMNQLGDAQGSAFDRMFLQMMIKHHEGAVQMAQTEQARGQNPEAIALAETIQDSQTAEIQHMNQLLRTM